MARSRKRRVRSRVKKTARRFAVVLVVLGAAAAAAFVLRPRALPPAPLTPPRFVSPARAYAPPVGMVKRDGARGAPATPVRVAIVIDDLGDSLESARAVLALEPPVTVAVIPFRPASTAVAAAAVQRGREVILHLPLEPEREDGMHGAAGFLRTGMPAVHLERQLDADLASVPYIVGVNGHMGSRFTRDPLAMERLLAALRTRGLFFLDSRTSPDSVAAATAARLRVPFAERALFLDHDPSPTAVERALADLTRTARRRGEAIAIGHPHATTISALEPWLREAARQGISIVPASALVR
jgi:polysaccharide deacetylase 2 family uncharacterized protein YibQ